MEDKVITFHILFHRLTIVSEVAYKNRSHVNNRVFFRIVEAVERGVMFAADSETDFICRSARA